LIRKFSNGEGTWPINAGDIIIKIDGKLTRDMMLWEAVKIMRGPKGAEVVITIVRKGLSEPVDFKLIRDIIPIESVRSIVLKPGYGYIRITNFQDNTTEDLELALKQLESGDVPLKGLVIDLRNNPGGLLNQSIEVSDLFLQKGEIVSIKGRLKTHTKIFNAHKNKIKRNYPIVVLINGGSASASEIVAGALQDHKRALILGTTSFGKGSVQTVETLRDGYGLKYTIARYYTPNGRSIQAQGIVPDIEVKYKIINNEDADDGMLMLKEKDLKNHLEAEPVEKDKIETESEEQKDKKKHPSMHLLETKHGPLKLEELQSDNQIMRALEILIGYEILKSM
jgi:carboxyl-terminal processing protease